VHKEMVLKKIRDRIQELEKIKANTLFQIDNEIFFLETLSKIIKLERKCERCDDLASTYTLERYLCRKCYDEFWKDNN
jgi:ribosomal protein S27AE